MLAAYLVALVLSAQDRVSRCEEACRQDGKTCVTVCKQYAGKNGAQCPKMCERVEKLCIEECRKK